MVPAVMRLKHCEKGWEAPGAARQGMLRAAQAPAGVVCLFLALTACEPPARAPDMVMRGPDNTVRPFHPDSSAEPSVHDEAAEVRRMVDESVVVEDDREIPVQEWINRKLEESGGQIMFPRWNVRRRGVNQFEVTFTYTVLKEDYSILKAGYVWKVDAVLRLVTAPTPLDEKDLERQSGMRRPYERPADENAGLFRLE